MKKFNAPKFILLSILGIVALMALAIGLTLNQKSQDTRSDASATQAAAYFSKSDQGETQAASQIEVIPGQEYTIILKLDTGRSRIIGHETTVQLDRSQFESVSTRANVGQFSFLNRVIDGGNTLKFIGIRPKGTSLIGSFYNSGIITVKPIVGFVSSTLTVTDAKYATEQRGVVLDGGQVVKSSVTLKSIANTVDTPTPRPTIEEFAQPTRIQEKITLPPPKDLPEITILP